MKWILGIAGLVLVAGCATVSDTAQWQLKKPINCNTARWDVEILEGEKANVAKRMAAGVKAVHPGAAVVGILRKTEKGRIKVATGQYNTEIDAKIADIKAVCRL